MPTYIDLTNLSPATITALSSTAPTITQVQITTSGYVVKDDTAVSTSGGYIKITGTNFTAGTQVVIGSVTATSVTFVNSTTLNVQVPAQAAGTYIIYVTVSNGGVAILVNGLTYSGDPTWVTGSTLPGNQVGSAISIQFSATGDAPVTYALQAGSTLPPGLSLTSGGLLSGTVTGITSETTYNFTVEAIDAQAQESPRAFSITITASDANFEYVTTLLSASNPASTFVTDASTNNFAVSVFGDTRPNNFNPYTPGYYSAYFDGSSSVVTASSSASFSPGTGDFTVECWVYISSYSQVGLFGNYSTGSSDAFWGFGILSSGAVFVSGRFTTLVSGGTVPLNSWTHAAVTRQSGTSKVWVNGVQTATSSTSLNFNGTGTMKVGIVGDFGNFTGYISNARFVNGTAVYTSTFTPSTTPLTAVANTAFLTCQSNRFIDNSTNNFSLSSTGSPQISGFDPFAPVSAYSTYGSGYFDGTGDYLSAANNAALNFGTGDFTLEAWIYVNSFASNSTILDKRLTSGSIAPWVWYTDTAGKLNFYTGTNYITTSSFPLNSWVHVVSSRVSGTLYQFINGVSAMTPTSVSGNLDTTGSLLIGISNDASPVYFKGYIADLRIVKGSGVTSVTVPTAPLTAIANTSLLTLQNNQPNNNSMFLDSSASNFLITRNGNTTQGSFSPYGGGWSNYFDGTGDYLSLSYNAAISIVSGDFTVEMWIYRTAGSAEQYLWSNRSDNPGTGWEWRINSTNLMQFFFTAGSSLTSSSTIPVNTWTHLAVTRQTNTVRMFINGTQDATATFSNGTSTSASLFIGWSTSSGGLFQGYMSNARLVKGTAVYTSNFTPSTTPLTPIANTSLLTCADNRFVDDSVNNFTVTRNGDVSVQRFNPFNPVLTTPTSYSGYFDGNGDFLSRAFTSTSDGMYPQGTTYTFEAWVMLNAAGGYTIYEVDATNTGSYGYWAISTDNSSKIAFSYRPTTGGSSTTPILGDTLQIGVWYHVAFSVSSGTARLFLNGVQTGSTASISAISFAPVGASIGNSYNGFSNAFWNGYISNVRIVQGTALYTSNFTPSTTPLTAVSGTSLLTCQNATFIDNSTNNFTLTVNGNSRPTQFNPFGWTNTTGSSAAYSATNYGGSMYFDGTGDYLNAGSNQSYAFGTSAYTVEFWVYPNSLAALHIYLRNNTSGGFQVYYDTTSGVGIGAVGSGGFLFGGALTVGQWQHVAVCRNSTAASDTRIFVNGVLRSSATDSTNWTITGALSIGADSSGTNAFNGFMSNLRVVKGQALYTSNFAPPVAPLAFNANAVLQVNGTSAAIYDSAMITTYETLGNASTTGVIKKYGNSSMYFDGNGDYLAASQNLGYNFGTGDFTIECWAYVNSISTYGGILDTRTGATLSNYALGVWSSGGNKLDFIYGSTRLTSAATFSTGQWVHFAVTRSSGTLRLFINGVVDTNTATFSSAINSARTNPLIGAVNDPYFLNGYLDDLRITNGVARYTANFTPPTTPFIQF